MYQSKDNMPLRVEHALKWCRGVSPCICSGGGSSCEKTGWQIVQEWHMCAQMLH